MRAARAASSTASRLGVASFGWLAAFVTSSVACHPAPPRAGDGGPIVVWTDPSDGADFVSRAPVLRVVYDRPLGPRAVLGDLVRLRSGDRSLELRLFVEPLTHTLEVRPVRALDPEIDYRLEVDGFADIEGSVGEAVVVHFSTGLDASPTPEPSATWADVAAIFEAGGTGGCANCHGGERPVLGLDLSSSEAVGATAIAFAAREVAPSGAAGPGSLGLVGLSRIEPGRPERSYLVYKILGEPHILGARMPAGGAPLDDADIATVIRWIRAGAPLE